MLAVNAQCRREILSDMDPFVVVSKFPSLLNRPNRFDGDSAIQAFYSGVDSLCDLLTPASRRANTGLSVNRCKETFISSLEMYSGSLNSYGPLALRRIVAEVSSSTR